MTFRRRLLWALLVSWTRLFGWLLWSTRFLTRLDAFAGPTNADADADAPNETAVRGLLVAATAGFATADACCWAATRPLLPKQPELARLTYEYVPNLVYWAGARKLANALGVEMPWRRALVPPRRRARGLATSALVYGAVERVLTRRRR